MTPLLTFLGPLLGVVELAIAVVVELIVGLELDNGRAAVVGGVLVALDEQALLVDYDRAVGGQLELRHCGRLRRSTAAAARARSGLLFRLLLLGYSRVCRLRVHDHVVFVSCCFSICCIYLFFLNL